jgi:prevent-host-death family protein
MRCRSSQRRGPRRVSRTSLEPRPHRARSCGPGRSDRPIRRLVQDVRLGMTRTTLSEFRAHQSKVLDAAQRGPVEILSRGSRRRAVVVSRSSLTAHFRHWRTRQMSAARPKLAASRAASPTRNSWLSRISELFRTALPWLALTIRSSDCDLPAGPRWQIAIRRAAQSFTSPPLRQPSARFTRMSEPIVDAGVIVSLLAGDLVGCGSFATI